MTVRDDALMLLVMREALDHYRGSTRLPREARILEGLQQALGLLEDGAPPEVVEWISRHVHDEDLVLSGNESFSARLRLLASFQDAPD